MLCESVRVTAGTSFVQGRLVSKVEHKYSNCYCVLIGHLIWRQFPATAFWQYVFYAFKIVNQERYVYKEAQYVGLILTSTWKQPNPNPFVYSDNCPTCIRSRTTFNFQIKNVDGPIVAWTRRDQLIAHPSGLLGLGLERTDWSQGRTYDHWR